MGVISKILRSMLRTWLVNLKLYLDGQGGLVSRFSMGISEALLRLIKETYAH